MIDDLRFAARSFVKSPGFTAVAVVALALGVGANTAIFRIVYTLLLQPLPWRSPQQRRLPPATGVMPRGFSIFDKIVAAIAALVPALRATRVDPAVALRA